MSLRRMCGAYPVHSQNAIEMPSSDKVWRTPSAKKSSFIALRNLRLSLLRCFSRWALWREVDSFLMLLKSNSNQLLSPSTIVLYSVLFFSIYEYTAKNLST